MSMRWVRLDVSFPYNRKILELAEKGRHRAITVYVCGLAYSGAQGYEGWIPSSALHLLHGRKQEATHLVDVGLWVPRPGGWDINDWHAYQPTNEEVEKRAARARAAALTRWNDNTVTHITKAKP